MRISLIIPAGGSGSRFKASLKTDRISSGGDPASLSKVFVPLAGKPLLIHTLQAFQPVDQIKEIIVALPEEAHSVFRKLIRQFRLQNIACVRGGKTRAESVWNALQKTSPSSDWVLIHDGARPLITQEVIRELIQKGRGHQAAILASPVIPTIKEAGSDGKILGTLDRDKLFAAETPQMTKRALLLKAYQSSASPFQATDEASLLEAAGIPVHLITHQGWNPKITTQNDWKLAGHYLGGEKRMETRSGIGRDTHRLVAGRKLMLGGVRIPYEKGTLGHSDGDALLHAVSDAVLGVLAAGDIGEWFSDKNPKFKNLASSKILKAVLQEAEKQGWRPQHVDTVITLERPKLKELKVKIKKNLADLMSLSPANVSIKAKTMEGLGPEGEGLAVTCEALVTMRKTNE